uniref:non-specific serine/threonine protein kinase n=1 Tax=Panagrellus redivivus TaxID=6233 RepID=A0A7E4UVV9_PANRE
MDGMDQSNPVLSSAVMPSSAVTIKDSQHPVAATPIQSLTTRRRMYPRISRENNDKALLGIGEMIRQRWLIKGMIGSGGYGQVYYALDTRQNEHVAVKVEPTKRNNKTVRRMILEQKVLLRLQGRSHVALMHGSGVEHDLNFIVLQLLSVNVGELRKQCPLKRFSKSTAGRIMQQAIAGIRDIHQIGYLHRDIKPANLCFGLSEAAKHRLIIVDFGLVRKYVNSDGRIRPRRERAGFRGTLRYVSLRVHDRLEQGPADDLIALMYSLIEMIHGELSWRKMNDANEIKAAKEELVKDDFRTVSTKFGSSIREFSRAVSMMGPEEEPNYRVLQELMRDFSGPKSISDSYDWENEYADVFGETEINRHLKIAV